MMSMGKNTPVGEELFIYFTDEEERNLQLDVPHRIPMSSFFPEHSFLMGQDS
jgi:hypothetical protein